MSFGFRNGILNIAATPFAPLCGPTSSLGAVQSASSGLSSSGYVETTTGSSSLPQFLTSSGVGSLVLIQSQTASNSSSLTFTTGITSAYNTYILIGSNILPITNASYPYVQLSVDGGSTYIASTYLSGMNTAAYNSATLSNVTTTSAFIVGDACSNLASSSFICFLQDMTVAFSATPAKATGQASTMTGSGSLTMNTFGGSCLLVAGSAVNALQVLMSTGNIAIGKFTLYGVLE